MLWHTVGDPDGEGHPVTMVEDPPHSPLDAPAGPVIRARVVATPKPAPKRQRRPAASEVTAAVAQARRDLEMFSDASIAVMLRRLAEARMGFPSGHDPSSSGDEVDEDGNPTARATSYSDRTGSLAVTSDPVEADIAALVKLIRRVTADTAALADLHRRWGQAAPVPRWCTSCRRDGGRREPVAPGRYGDACRFCGDSRSRNGGEFPPLAILRAHHLGQHVTDQLIAAHPLPNGQLWKRDRRR